MPELPYKAISKFILKNIPGEAFSCKFRKSLKSFYTDYLRRITSDVKKYKKKKNIEVSLEK